MRQVIGCYLSTSILLFAAEAHAQIVAPRLGYIWDSGARAIRSIDGIPGASILGSAADIGTEFDSAAVSQRARYLLGIGVSGGRAYLFQIGPEISRPEVIERATVPVDRIAVSPSGSSAALYNGRGGILQVITGMPRQAKVMRSIAVSAVDRIAVSDDGVAIIFAAAENDAVLAMDSTGPTSLAIPGPVSAIAFRPHSHDFLIAAGGLITFVQTIDSQPTYRVVGDLPGNPASLAFSADGLRFVAGYPDGRIQMSDLSLGALPPAQCTCRPTALEPLAGDSLFLVRTDAMNPVFLFDGARNRVIFVGRDEQ